MRVLGNGLPVRTTRVTARLTSAFSKSAQAIASGEVSCLDTVLSLRSKEGNKAEDARDEENPRKDGEDAVEGERE